MAPLPILPACLLATTLFSSYAAGNAFRLDIVKNQIVQARQLSRRSPGLQRRYDGLRARGDTVTAPLDNDLQEGLYSAKVTVGTPAQTFGVQIDTGSSDMWVPSSSAPICSNTAEGGCPGGAFDTSKSSTYHVVESNGFNISYVDGTGAAGDYFQDTFSIGGVTIKNFEMGLEASGSIGQGIMGIGYNTSEANVATGNGSVYANLPQALQNAGLINANAYSLWLDDLQASTGSVLFGGIDTKKYTGDLMSINIYPSVLVNGQKIYLDFTVAFTSLSATSETGTDMLTPSNYVQPVILDSGTTLCLLPNDIASTVFEELGAEVSEQLDATVVPCSLASKTGSLNFGFGGPGGPVIAVNVSQLVLPLVDSNGQPVSLSNGEQACQLGLQAAGNDPILFGDIFLRSAYVVYDLDNNRIALAQTDFNSTDSNVVAFAGPGAAIPSATNAPNQAEVTQTVTGNPNGPANGITASGSGVITYNPTNTGLSAAGGFTSTGSPSSKKNAAPVGASLFPWSMVVTGAITLLGMGLGGGLLMA